VTATGASAIQESAFQPSAIGFGFLERTRRSRAPTYRPSRDAQPYPRQGDQLKGRPETGM